MTINRIRIILVFGKETRKMRRERLQKEKKKFRPRERPRPGL